MIETDSLGPGRQIAAQSKSAQEEAVERALRPKRLVRRFVPAFADFTLFFMLSSFFSG